MEEHLNRSALPRQRFKRNSPHSLPSNSYVLKFPELRVLVTDGDSDMTKRAIELFRSIDAKVDFAMRSDRTASELAQRSGSRFHPVNDDESYMQFVKRVVRDRGGVDIIISTGNDAMKRENYTMEVEGVTPLRIIRYGYENPQIYSTPILTINHDVPPASAALMALMFASRQMDDSTSLKVESITV